MFPLRLMILKNTEPSPIFPHLLAQSYSRLFLESYHDRALDELQVSLPFFIHAILLDQVFTQCPRFLIAAPSGILGRVSVLVWIIIQKYQLRIIGLCPLVNQMVLHPSFDSDGRHRSHETSLLLLQKNPCPLLIMDFSLLPLLLEN